MFIDNKDSELLGKYRKRLEEYLRENLHTRVSLSGAIRISPITLNRLLKGELVKASTLFKVGQFLIEQKKVK